MADIKNERTAPEPVELTDAEINAVAGGDCVAGDAAEAVFRDLLTRLGQNGVLPGPGLVVAAGKTGCFEP
jgi:hypothetical protein